MLDLSQAAPADPAILARVEPWLGVPWHLHGLAPTLPGWDCRGLMAYVRAELFGRASPSARDAFPAASALARDQLAGFFAARIGEALAAWREVPPIAGAAVLLRMFGQPSHVGVYLGGADFVHVAAGSATALDRLDGPLWRGRVVGFYDV